LNDRGTYNFRIKVPRYGCHSSTSWYLQPLPQMILKFGVPEWRTQRLRWIEDLRLPQIQLGLNLGFWFYHRIIKVFEWEFLHPWKKIWGLLFPLKDNAGLKIFPVPFGGKSQWRSLLPSTSSGCYWSLKLSNHDVVVSSTGDKMDCGSIILLDAFSCQIKVEIWDLVRTFGSPCPIFQFIEVIVLRIVEPGLAHILNCQSNYKDFQHSTSDPSMSTDVMAETTEVSNIKMAWIFETSTVWRLNLPIL